MNLRTAVAVVATCAIAVGACKKDQAPAGEPAPSGEAQPTAAPSDQNDKGEPAAAVADSEDPMRRAMALQRKALEILKANKSDATAAAAALEVLYKEREAEINALKVDFEKLGEQLKNDPNAAMEMMAKYMGEIQELTKLTTDLLTEAPELMGSPDVAAAMGKLSPTIGDDDDDDDHDHAGHDHDHAGHDHDHGHDHGHAAGGPPLSDEDKALLNEMLVTQEKMVEILAANAADADKAGEELMKFATEQSASLAKFQNLQQRLQGNQAAAMEFAQQHMPRITALGQKMSEIAQSNPGLMTNAKVQAAMVKMSGAE